MSYQIETAEVVKRGPQEWAPKDAPMTGAQASYLKSLCDQHGEKFYETLTKSQAAVKIDSLKQQSSASITRA